MIRKLPPHLIQQIAAGEVIERPASVLKELVENSLDAEASRIDIRYRRGGLDSLSVEDDGHGILEDDLELALEAHATSKLRDVSDLENIQSLGFRGEALAATAAVSELTIETSHREVNRGAKIQALYGRLLPMTPIDNRRGTKVLVRGLFQKVPARLKFLKSDRSETLALTQVLRRYALCYPTVAWSFGEEDQKPRYQLAASSALERSLWFFDAKDPEYWSQTSAKTQEWKIHLIFQKPRYLGSSAKGFQIFLNSRPLKDVRLETAIRRGFEGFTEFPREMSAVLYIEGSPRLFDVNVHPTKMEVRFLDPDPLFSLIVESLRNCLNQDHRALFAPNLEPDHQPVPRAEPPSYAPMSRDSTVTVTEKSVVPLFSAPTIFEYLYSIDNTYLVCRRGQELVLFDQHALHERILYERLLKTFESQDALPSQRLLFPLKVSRADLGDFVEKEELLRKLGYEIREWTSTEVHVLTAPAQLKRRQVEALLEIADLNSKGSETLMRDTLATMACHAAVRAHDDLSREEIQQLLKDFSSEDALGHCPHGRPTFVRLTLRDLEKMFHRVL